MYWCLRSVNTKPYFQLSFLNEKRSTNVIVTVYLFYVFNNLRKEAISYKKKSLNIKIITEDKILQKFFTYSFLLTFWHFRIL